MLRALRTAALGMAAQQMGVDNTANNLANANTTGYKRTNVVFQDLLYQTVQAPGQGEAQGESRPATLEVGHGAAVIATVRSFEQGGFVETSNPLDLAINGNGFFQVRRPDGTVAYSRDGTFTIDAEGLVTTQNGLPLEPDLTIPTETAELIVRQDGEVAARLHGTNEIVVIGQLELARFTNPTGLQSIGGNLYEQTQASGEPMIAAPGQDSLGTVRQGFLESANVDVVQEMVQLITAQRAYEINSKMVTTSEEMLQIANTMKR